ncbi:hypothetical protein ZIOFF_060812 [Zingiber officinale]|uniref:2-phytyl-1,4-beta-naphthoquinone methyltransferase, chloroplastic n=1 Tax=Zingiber officinale TaxID=94328 RepID=A0A8J5FB57_ZINOF|nr:hypothetical protein ZIOFF_060812 [Zingiber officinale]
MYASALALLFPYSICFLCFSFSNSEWKWQLNDLLSLGLHRSWKRMCISWSGAKKGDRALDLCCGSGDLTFLLSQKVGLQGEVRLLAASSELHFLCHLELYLHFTIHTRSFGCIANWLNLHTLLNFVDCV